VAIWETGQWPEERTSFTFIPLPKKGDLKQCENYRIIALVSHASKILLRMILERIRVKTETEIVDKHAGFRQGRGTRDQITNLRILMHKAREHQQPLYICFMDFKKAFDSISHDKLWVINTTNYKVEDLWLEINKCNKKYIIGGIYRHPNQNITDFRSMMEATLSKISLQKHSCIIAGDLNIDLVYCSVIARWLFMIILIQLPLIILCLC